MPKRKEAQRRRNASRTKSLPGTEALRTDLPYILPGPCHPSSLPRLTSSSQSLTNSAMAVAFIPLDKAYLTAIWLETLLYGLHCPWFRWVPADQFSSSRYQPVSILLIRLHPAVPTSEEDHAYCFLGRSVHVLLLNNTRLARLLSVDLGIHRVARSTRWSRRVLFGRLYAAQRRQSHYPLGQLYSGRQHRCT